MGSLPPEHGFLRSITGTNPAAGVEVSESVPTNARWKLVMARVQLVTSAVVATRRVRLVIDDGVNVLTNLTVQATQAASLTRNYVFDTRQFDQTAFDSADNFIHTALPLDLFLFQGWRFRTVTDALDAGDDYPAPQYAVEEWIEE